MCRVIPKVERKRFLLLPPPLPPNSDLGSLKNDKTNHQVQRNFFDRYNRNKI